MLLDRALSSQPLDAGLPPSSMVPFVGTSLGAGSLGPRCSTMRGLHRLYRLALDMAHVIEIHGYLGSPVPRRPLPHKDIPFSFRLATLAIV